MCIYVVESWTSDERDLSKQVRYDQKMAKYFYNVADERNRNDLRFILILIPAVFLTQAKFTKYSKIL